MCVMLWEEHTTGFQDSYLYFVYLLSIVLGIYIIISKNPIVSILFLIGLFCSMSIYIMVIGLYFIGLSYLLVYVGAISILFLFILMLINIRVSELLTNNNNSIPLAVLSVISFNYAINNVLPSSIFMDNNLYTYIAKYISNTNEEITNETNDKLYYIIEQMSSENLVGIDTKSWQSVMVTVTHISSMGNIMYTNLFVFSIIISIILLLAMVGSIVITIHRPIKDQ